jgi:AGZA family xanthine/uracil permease-like MFS transporter
MAEEAVVAEEQGGGQQPHSWSPKTGFGRALDRYFGISSRGSSIIRELVGGLVTFLAMFYILPLNSGMLSTYWADPNFATAGNVQVIDGVVNILIYGDLWMPASNVYAAVFVATALSASITTIIMGLYGKLPVGLASGLGINSLIAYTIMQAQGWNFAQSMCVVFIDGVLFLIISLTPLRKMIINAIPKSLKFAISAGIGFFIAFIGLYGSGIVKQGNGTPVGLGDLTQPAVLLAICGIALVVCLSALPQKNKVGFWVSKFAVIISLFVIGIISATCGTCGVESSPAFTTFYDSSFSYSSFSSFGQVIGCCFFGFDVFANPLSYAVVFTLLFVDFFDTAGTLVGVESAAGMVNDDGVITVNDRPAMVTDAIGTVIGSVFGTTTVTSFVESTTGVAAGARTGLASVFTGLLFALSLGIFPALAMFDSSIVTGLALFYVGICMFKNLERLEWKDWVAVGSGFVTVIVMTLAYSISDGIAWGFITYTLMTLVAGRFNKKDIPVACCSAAFLIIYIVKYATGLA